MARPQTFIEALENLRGLRDSELQQLLEATAQGDPEAMEWADERLLDLQFAYDQLREIIHEGVRGGLVSVAAAAAELGLNPTSFYRRIKREGIPTIEAPSFDTKGPRKMRYVSREAVEALARR